MKKLVVIFSLILTSIVSEAQNEPKFSNNLIYKAEFGEFQYRGSNFTKKLPGPVTFSFDSTLMMSTLKDHHSRIRYYKIEESGNDGDFSYTTYKCRDNAGQLITVFMTYQKTENVSSIILCYSNYDLLFNVKAFPAPIKETFITDDIESLGVFGENNTEDISIEEFKTRVNESGKLIGIDNLGNRLEPIIKAAVFNEIANGVTSADNKPKRWQKGSSVDDQHIVIEKK
ncbi:MAG: hypothetical protein GYA51_01050 [Candidatus Methanofastidiosa archaeon]|nr:hypothetical protein [Candidatus Methanofastidiosa archaeon]